MLLSLLFIVSLTAATCVKRQRQNGLVNAIGYHLFPNGTFFVFDSTGRVGKFDRQGNLIELEQLNLQEAATVNGNLSFVSVVVGDMDDYYFETSVAGTFRYFDGRLISSLMPKLLTQVPRNSTQFVRGFHSGFSVFTKSDGFSVYCISILKLHLKFSLTDQSVVGKDTVGRIAAGPFVNSTYREMYLVTNNNKVLVVPFNYSDKGDVSVIMAWGFAVSSSEVGSKVIEDSGLYVISSSVGANEQLVAYAGLALSSEPGAYRHLLVVRPRATPSVAQVLEVWGFHVHSVAVHPSTNRLFLYTTRGALFVQELTAGPAPLFVGEPVLLAATLFHKFADLEVLDATTLLLRTGYSLASYDLATPGPALTAVFLNKPSFGRRLRGADRLLLVFHNQFAQLFDIRSHAIDTAASSARRSATPKSRCSTCSSKTGSNSALPRSRSPCCRPPAKPCSPPCLPPRSTASKTSSRSKAPRCSQCSSAAQTADASCCCSTKKASCSSTRTCSRHTSSSTRCAPSRTT
jgi:hypothetical protein